MSLSTRRFEHKVIELPLSAIVRKDSTTKMEKALNDEARSGWELVGVREHAHLTGQSMLFFMKRRVA